MDKPLNISSAMGAGWAVLPSAPPEPDPKDEDEEGIRTGESKPSHGEQASRGGSRFTKKSEAKSLAHASRAGSTLAPLIETPPGGRASRSSDFRPAPTVARTQAHSRLGRQEDMAAHSSVRPKKEPSLAKTEMLVSTHGPASTRNGSRVGADTSTAPTSAHRTTSRFSHLLKGRPPQQPSIYVREHHGTPASQGADPQVSRVAGGERESRGLIGSLEDRWDRHAKNGSQAWLPKSQIRTPGGSENPSGGVMGRLARSVFGPPRARREPVSAPAHRLLTDADVQAWQKAMDEVDRPSGAQSCQERTNQSAAGAFARHVFVPPPARSQAPRVERGQPRNTNRLLDRIASGLDQDANVTIVSAPNRQTGAADAGRSRWPAGDPANPRRPEKS